MITCSKLPVKQLCKSLEVSRSGFYKWKKRIQPPDLDFKLRLVIQEIALEFPCYGYRRITKELHRRGLLVNHKRVLKIMREDNLLCIRKKFRPVTTQSNHGEKVYPNLVKHKKIRKVNQVWVSDITYIRLLYEFIYLAVILDLFSRKCVGWNLSRTIDTHLTLGALDMAIIHRKKFGFSQLIHHSDQGAQYAASEYVDRLETYDITISMSRKGNVYDNAFAESFMKTLKVEEVYMNEYDTYEVAYNNIKQFIEEVYNDKRLHSAIGYLPPNEFEKEVLNTC